MYQNNDFHQYLHQIQQKLDSQSKKITGLEKNLTDLQAKLIKLEKDKALHVDKIEYNFDQLKIETLEGTLNIGMSPNKLDSAIEDFEADENNNLRITNNIQKQMDDYFKEDVFNDISVIEKKHDYYLNDEYKHFVINDLKKQTNKQIASYVQNSEIGINTENIDALQTGILKKVIADVNKGVEAFIKKLPREEKNN